MAAVRFADGALGVIEASTAVYPGYHKRIEIHGIEGSAVMEGEDLVKWDFAKKRPRNAAIQRKMAVRTGGGGGAADPAAIGHHGHTRQFRDVLAAIRKGTAPSVDGTEGRRSVEIILAIYKAAETGGCRFAAPGHRPAAQGKERSRWLKEASHARSPGR